MTPRQGVLRSLAQHALALSPGHPTRVALDGCSAAGKTTMADELASVLSSLTDRQIIRAGTDHFKRHVSLRPPTPAGYYAMLDEDAIKEHLLLPLGPSGSRRYRTAVMDLPGRTPVDAPPLTAEDDAILVADGCFLQKPGLFPFWDLRIYLDVDPADVQRRGTDRDQAWMPSREAAAERYRTYYIPGEQLYLRDVDPATRADIVVDNRDFDAPRITGAR